MTIAKLRIMKQLQQKRIILMNQDMGILDRKQLKDLSVALLTSRLLL
jgi:hypothetical protein